MAPPRLKGATVHLALERPLNSLPANLAPLPANPSTNREACNRAFLARHRSANSFVLTAVDAQAAGNQFAVALKVPDDLPWSNVVIRASATLSNDSAIGAIALPAKVATAATRAR